MSTLEILHERAAFQKKLSEDTAGRLTERQIVWLLFHWETKQPSSVIELNKLLERGIPVSAVNSFSKVMGIPMTDIAPMLNLSYKTLTRKKKTETFDPAISSLVYEIAATYAHALEIFRDLEKVNQWFDRSNSALASLKPIDLLRTMTGINLVNQVLGRIEEGVYS